MLTVDLNGTITSWNKAAERLYGYPASEVIGKPLTMLTLPEDLAEVLRNADRIKHSQQVETYDTVRVNKDGHEMNLEAVLSPVKDSSGAVIGVSTIARDVTERRQAQEAKFHLAAFVESSQDSIVTINLESVITSWNRAAEQLYGYLAAEAIGKSLTELVLPQNLLEVLVNIENVAHNQKVEIFDSVRLHKDDHELHLEVVMSPVKDEAGQVIGVSTMARDVTVSRLAQEALLKSEEKYRTLFETIGEGLCIIKVVRLGDGAIDYRFLDLNSAYERIIGITRSELVGRTVREAMPELEDVWYETMERVAFGGESIHLEEYVAPVGKWLETNFSPLGDGKISVIFSDITERKLTEEALRHSEETFSALVENAPFGVYLIDAEFRLRLTNEGSRKVFSGIEPLIGRDFAEVLRILWHEPFADEAIKRFRHTLRTGESFISPPIVEPRANIEEIEAYDWQLHRVTLPNGSYGVVCYFYDLSEQKRMEAAVRESEERLTLAASVSNFGVHDFDVENKYLYWSPELKAMHGLNTDEPVTFETLPDLFHPEDRERMNRAMQASLDPKGTGEFEQEFRIVRPDTNETRWLYSRSRTAFSGKGKTKKATRNTGIVIDVTSRKRAEEAVRESETRFRAIVNQATAAIAEYDLEGNYTLVNETLCDLLGYTQAELLQMNQRDLTHPEDMPLCLEMFEQAIATGKASVSEKRVIRKDNSIVWTTESISSIGDADGKPRHVALIAFDISERKEVEEAFRTSSERLQLLIESTSDYAIFTTTLDNRIDSWNAGAEQIFGWTESEAVGQTGAIIFTSEDRASGAPEMEITTALAEGRAPDERFHIRKDGSRFYVSGVMNLLREANGQAHGFVKICRDMTERIEAEKALRAKEILQQLVGAQEDERKRIARDLHDELGQKLTALRLKLESIRKMCEDDDLCSQIDETQLIAKHIDDDVDFLAWELRPAALDHLGLAAALDNYVREWSRHAGITAETHFTGIKNQRLRPEIETNLYRITQEALNNTHKHAKAKSVNIIVEGHDGSVVLIIEDDGTGFDPESTINRSKGLGLIGMRERAALVGGTLEIESAPEQGTTIFVRVPAFFAE
jgi:PAS domain S-box-containing protein